VLDTVHSPESSIHQPVTIGIHIAQSGDVFVITPNTKEGN